MVRVPMFSHSCFVWAKRECAPGSVLCSTEAQARLAQTLGQRYKQDDGKRGPRSLQGEVSALACLDPSFI